MGNGWDAIVFDGVVRVSFETVRPVQTRVDRENVVGIEHVLPLHHDVCRPTPSLGRLKHSLSGPQVFTIALLVTVSEDRGLDLFTCCIDNARLVLGVLAHANDVVVVFVTAGRHQVGRIQRVGCLLGEERLQGWIRQAFQERHGLHEAGGRQNKQ